MKTLTALTLAVAGLASAPVLAADIESGKQKSAACVVCHGDQNFAGLFYTYQLAGRNADKLTIKTNKYRTGKILHPVMNLATMGLTEKDIENISAYYQSMGKPALTSPLFKIKGDDDVDSTAQVAATSYAVKQ